MKIKLSRALKTIYAEGAFVWGDYAKKQEEISKKPVLRLQVGQPDFLPHPLLRRAIADAFLEGKTAYGLPLGDDNLREEVAKEVSQYYQKAKIKKENVAITTGGGKSAIGVVFKALLNPKEKVLVPAYNYPGHFSGISDAGGLWQPYRLLAEKGYDLDSKDFEKKIKKVKPKVILIISPGNPTGGVFSPSALELISYYAKKYQIPVVSDEIYRAHIFEERFLSILDFKGMEKLTIIIDGPGKRNCVPGMRIGYIIGPKEFIDGPVRKLNNVKFSCPPMAEQIGLAKVINHPEIKKYIQTMVKEFRQRRDFTVKELNKNKKIYCPNPGGAFYLFPDISKTGYSGEELAKKLLKEKNVCVLPGGSFGGGMIDSETKKPYGYYHIRISIASPMAVLKEAIKRINQLI